MEIEAKFALPSEEALQHLLAIDNLAGFSLSEGQAREVRDLYLDTADHAILAAGYACRRREQAEGLLITLKSLEDAEGAVHRREEWQIALPADAPPSKWPTGPVRDRIRLLIGKSKLKPLVALRQTRIIRQLSQGGKPIAELSLDRVYMTDQKEDQVCFELEVELAPEGTEGDLTAIVSSLRKEWNLVPEARSKFERGLDFLHRHRSTGELLTPRERAICVQISKRDDLYVARARILLAAEKGMARAEIGQRANRSERRVRHWIAEFRRKRMDIFPAGVLVEVSPLLPTETPPKTKSEDKESTHDRLQVRPKSFKLPDKTGLDPDDSMAEAARKTMYFHFQHMLCHEPGTRLGEDIEELHDMRVATRRMRAAFQVFESFLDMDVVKPFLKDLRRTGRTLGAVRDLDVFWEKTQHYLNSLPPEQQDSLKPLKMVWEAERQRAQEKMLAYLDSDRYAQFKEQFGAFLQTSGAGALPPFSAAGEPLPNRLRYVVPVLVYQRLATVRAYDEWVIGQDVPLARLHMLRIDGKRLRYTLEFFQEILGEEAKTLIQRMKELQDHLGNLQDAVVASNLLRDFLTWGTWGHTQIEEGRTPMPQQPVLAPGVATYLAARQTELQHLFATFPQVLAPIQSPEFVQLVARMLSVL